MIYASSSAHGLFFTNRNSRCGLVLLVMSLLMTGCKPSDAKLSELLVGTWKQGGNWSWKTFDSNRSFQFKMGGVWTNNAKVIVTNELNSSGLWNVKNGFLILTVTNSHAVNITNITPVGSIVRLKISSLTDSELVFRDDEINFRYQRE